MFPGPKFNVLVTTLAIIRKSILWEHQKEWRLVFNHVGRENIPNPIIAPRISKIYLGCQIDRLNEMKIQEICETKNIEVEIADF